MNRFVVLIIALFGFPLLYVLAFFMLIPGGFLMFVVGLWYVHLLYFHVDDIKKIVHGEVELDEDH